MKKRGFGEGRFNGFGGKVDAGESILDAALRELHEEAHITATYLFKLGILEFSFENNQDILEVHVFKCTTYTGEVGESEEMRPEWFEVNSIPFEEMWKDDIFWFPLFLENKCFKGKFAFDIHENLIAHELREVEKV